MQWEMRFQQKFYDAFARMLEILPQAKPSKPAQPNSNSAKRGKPFWQARRLSLLSDVEDEDAYCQDPLVSFWNDIVRSATALTRLTIRSDHPVGAYPALSFRDTFLPLLASLTLYGFVLEPIVADSDVVAFILRHKGTLARLALHGCSIDGGEDGVFLRPWHALFEAEIDSLRNFLFVNDDAARESEFERDARFVYTRLDPGWGYMPWNEELATEGLDLPALESLQAVVKSRRLGAD
ncbi:hypothetical protein DFH08DRAFT_1040043 [Mycena albidolilacea]|uniref:Uncharacterized protein n=1 Tax=Mycena albidolilacea TaxID=1033008 RepID=A0AAD6ZBU0_9AGAR|nr:hypothetical protein DFH08DRAFT_1040043 [Mycena albidolilacea]